MGGAGEMARTVGAGASREQILGSLSGRSATHYRAQHVAELELLHKSYGRVSTVSEAKMVVDSSKNPGYFLNLLNTNGFELYFVHLVRDPLAVAASWVSKKRTLDASADEEFPIYAPFRSALQWSLYNFFASNFRKSLGSRYMQVSHEEFCATPGKVVREVLGFLGEDYSDVSLDQCEFGVRVHHTISGNPSRFITGRVRVEEKDSPKLNMMQRLLVRGLTGPASAILKQRR
ncbi:hypothetical protein GALL_538220 [mine drainage metagenome]|uniref:Uncharacterized protein n=1 Tax=mine drainage metagenome TaxID=410659 RepID=A0A1J5P0P7_9ZZZZ